MARPARASSVSRRSAKRTREDRRRHRRLELHLRVPVEPRERRFGGRIAGVVRGAGAATPPRQCDHRARDRARRPRHRPCGRSGDAPRRLREAAVRSPRRPWSRRRCPLRRAAGERGTRGRDRRRAASARARGLVHQHGERRDPEAPRLVTQQRAEHGRGADRCSCPPAPQTRCRDEWRRARRVARSRSVSRQQKQPPATSPTGTPAACASAVSTSPLP